MFAGSLLVRGKKDPDATAFIDRLTGSYSSGEINAINAFFVGLKADGLYQLFDVFHLLCLDNSTDSSLNLLSTSLTCTSIPGFSPRVGISGGSPTFSGFIPASHAVNMIEDSNHIGIYLSDYVSTRTPSIVSAFLGNPAYRFYTETREISAGREITNRSTSDSKIGGLTANEYPGTYINARSGDVMYGHAGNVTKTVTRAGEHQLSNYRSQLSSTPGVNTVTALYAGGYINSTQSQQLEDRLKTLFTALGVPYS